MCAHLELLLRQFKVEGIKVALDVGHACCFGDDTGAVLNGPSDQDLRTTEADLALLKSVPYGPVLTSSLPFFDTSPCSKGCSCTHQLAQALLGFAEAYIGV